MECLKNSAEWHSYSASESFSVADMAMYACKNVGCALNYCSLVKMGWPSGAQAKVPWPDTPGSSQSGLAVAGVPMCPVTVAEVPRYLSQGA